MALITARGLTVITAVKATPTQEPLVGVIVYVAVRCILTGLVNVPEKLAAPMPVATPVKSVFVTGKPHAYVVAIGTMPLVVLVGEYSKESPEQITAVNGLIWAVGLMFTVNVNGSPRQAPVVGLV
jgi:hypothetical protein